MKPFKKLIGYRVYLEIPQIPESKVILSEETRREFIEQQKHKLNKLKVYAVGDLVSLVKEGDEVAMDMPALARAITVKLTEDLEVLSISQHDIAHIW